MPRLKLYNAHSVAKLVAGRPGETKLGESLEYISEPAELFTNPSEYVIFGIPEDIGVRANHGIPGTSEAWSAFLKSFLNLQHNRFLDPEKILILGEIDCSEEMRKASNLEASDPNYYPKLGELVEKIDEEVSRTLALLLSAGKRPIIIGGGHNNAYGNIKGAARALGAPINVLNLDAHTDLRQLEHRHSGNGFSSALAKGYLEKYAIFGVQPEYTPQFIYDRMQASEAIRYEHFEELQEAPLEARFQECLQFVNTNKFGLEVDCDVIAHFPSSASSPSGFSLDQVKSLLRLAAREKNCLYLHLCEAAIRKEYPTGKALSLLVSAFIRTNITIR